VRLLLDTHTAIWWRTSDARLSDTVIDELSDESNPVLLSAVVVWEAALKRSLGKLDVPEDLRTMLEFDVQPLPVTLEHAAMSEHLPWHHRDPFDRMLVAQAQVERATIVSADPKLRRYDVPVLW